MMLTGRVRPRRALRASLLLPVLAVLLACDDNPYDRTQIPQITIVPVIAAPLVVISWQPAGAQQVRVYKGSVANGNADLLMWAVSATGKNTLVSGIEYGATSPTGGRLDQAAKPLVSGQSYTVEVLRSDPKSKPSDSLNGFNTRYANTQTFQLAVGTPAP